MNLAQKIAGASLLLFRHGVSVANTVAPSHDYEAPLTPVIDTQITGVAGEWTGNPTITHQWQRNNGAWVDIGGATNINYTPTDSDFGLTLRRLEIPNGNAAAAVASAATGAVAEVPSQTLGAELVVNGGFDSDTVWSKGTNWTIAAGVAHKAAGTTGGLTQNTVAYVDGAIHVLTSTVLNFVAGSFSFRVGGSGVGPTQAANGSWEGLIRATGTTQFLIAPAVTFEGDVDNIGLKTITPNTQLTAPSADMRIEQFYTLPGSPKIGEHLWLLVRISDFAAGNYWLVLLQYTGSVWTAGLYSVASHTRTARISPVTVGATDGIAIEVTGNAWELFTTADGGDNWTSRGTVSNATYNTATGVNAIAVPSVTLGQMAFVNP